MMKPTDGTDDLEARAEALRAEVAKTGLMRPGSLVKRYRKCGKANCHCAAPESAGHGPQWLLTREVGGKTVSRAIPANRVDETRSQLEEHKRFRERVHELVEVNVALCDEALKTQSPANAAAQKGGSRRRSPEKSSRTSKR